MMSAGIRSGVNWMRANGRSRDWASVRTRSVFPRPGTPSSRPWPPASTQVRTPSTIAPWPTITLPTSARRRSYRCPNSAARASMSMVRCPGAIGNGPAKTEENAKTRKRENAKSERFSEEARRPGTGVRVFLRPSSSALHYPLRVFAPSRFRVLFGPFPIAERPSADSFEILFHRLPVRRRDILLCQRVLRLAEGGRRDRVVGCLCIRAIGRAAEGGHQLGAFAFHALDHRVQLPAGSGASGRRAEAAPSADSSGAWLATLPGF